MLRELGPGLWVAETPLRFVLEVGRRMNVVRLDDAGLLVHSPAKLDEPLRAALAALGEVRFVVPANALHGHLFMEQYAEAYPHVELFATPGLQRRRKDLTFAGELGDVPDPRWASVLDQALMRGHRAMHEVVFLHRPTRSLIIGDIGMNFGDDAPPATRLFARLGGMRGRLRPTPIFRSLIRDRDEWRRSLERVLAWDFDRIVTGHGEIVETGGKEALRGAYPWL